MKLPFVCAKIAELLVFLPFLSSTTAGVPRLRASIANQHHRRLVDVSFKGDNRVPAVAFPLGQCEGDCDSDNQCAGDLVCFQRGVGDPSPPGCSGEPTEDNDYCYDVNDNPVLPSPVLTGDLKVLGNDGLPASVYPLGRCHADCDNDDECAGNLVCFQRRSSNNNVPGCDGSPDGSNDYCVRPEDILDVPAPLPEPVMNSALVVVNSGDLKVLGNDGSPASVYPLGRCHADCDNDGECAGNLVCFQRRSSNNNVPGCDGSPDGSNDYCVRPEDILDVPAPLPEPVMNSASLVVNSGDLKVLGNDGSPASVYPLGRCHADCDNDGECAGNLVCFQRRSSNNKVPGCDGSPDGSNDYCVRPEDMLPTLDFPGNDHNPPEVYPLERCSGDCDGDYDCAGSLVCHQRNGFDPVPSCAGMGVENNDYCIRPSDETAQPPVAGAFRLKLYWEPGYEWQDVFWENEWCMRCTSSDCDLFDQLALEVCDDDSTWFDYLNQNTATGQTQIQIATTDLCIELVGNQKVELRTCVSSSDRQKFEAGNGSFGGDKFELKTVVNGGCLSNHHHPTAGEIIYRNACSTSRADDTSFWNQY